MSAIDQVIAALNGAKKTASGWTALCPAHEDRRPSLSVSERSGQVLVHCHAGCSQTDVIDALKRLNAWPESASTNGHKPWCVAEYDYVGADGTLLYTIQRMSDKQFFPRLPDGRNTLKGVDRVLYRLPAVLKAPSVVVVEGEKDVHTVESLGLVATTCAGGSKAWRREFAESLRGKRVAILPDNDEPGRTFANEVLESLRDVAAWAAVIRLPVTKAGGDVSDWALGKSDEDARRQLVEMIRGAEAWRPLPPSSLIRVSAAVSRQVEFAWRPYIPLGKVTLIDGDPGVGKSWLTAALACGITTGQLPDPNLLTGWTTFDPAPVLLLSAEDDVEDTIRPRLEAIGADLHRCFVASDYFQLDDAGLTKLEEMIRETAARVVFVDPLVAYFGGTLDMNAANETRAVMAALSDLAARTKSAIVGIRHLRKESQAKGGKAIYRGTGSIDIIGAARSALIVYEDEDSQNRERVVRHIKSNVAAKGEELRYTIRDGRFLWLTHNGPSRYQDEEVDL